MAFRDFVAVPENFENLDISVHEAGRELSHSALLRFRRADAGGSITFLPAGLIRNVSPLKNKRAWSLGSPSSKNTMRAIKRRRKVFEIETDKERYEMKPIEEEKFGYNVYRLPDSKKLLKWDTEELIFTISIESSHAWSYRIIFDPSRGMELPMFCLCLMNVSHLKTERLPRFRRLWNSSRGIRLSSPELHINPESVN